LELEFDVVRILILTATLLALLAPLAGCKRSLDQRDVLAFIDKADTTARKRFAPEIYEPLRASSPSWSSRAPTRPHGLVLFAEHRARRQPHDRCAWWTWKPPRE
jgi:hypothetical protein